MTQEQTKLKEGNNWIAKTYKISGRWAIEKKENDLYFILSDDFKTSKGPDLKVYITKDKVMNLPERHSVDKDGVFIAELKSHKGAQHYKLPENITISEYNSIIIHCKAYSVVWGGIEL